MAQAATLLNRFEQLLADRRAWETVWQEIGDYVLPRRATFAGERTPGDTRAQKLYDGTAIQANELLASGLHSLLTSPTQRWFRLHTADPDMRELAGVKAWLEQASDVMVDCLASPRSQFTPAMHELYLDLCAFGTGCMLIGEGYPERVQFQTVHLGEIAISENAAGQVDTVFRRYSLSARQVVETWGERASPPVQRAAASRPDSRVALLHAVAPREGETGKPILSTHLEIDGAHTLAESGFEEFPFVVPRWRKLAGERYGRSPAWSVLPDIKMINAMSRTVIRAAQKIVDPPLLVADDGVVLPVRTVPGGLNFGGVDASGRQLIQPLRNEARVDIGLEMMEQRRAAIRQAFYIDQLQMGAGATMSATEVVARTEERLRLLAPSVGRLQSELLGPLVERVFAILLRSGAFPLPPASLRGRDIRIEYLSPLALAQKLSDLAGVRRVIDLLAPLAAMQPGIFDVLDGDRIARFAAEMSALPRDAVRNARALESYRQARVLEAGA